MIDIIAVEKTDEASNKEWQGRGMLTSRIKAKSNSLLGYEITQKELRLMPYIQYVMVNNQRINPREINEEERKILQNWRSKGYIDGGASGMKITEEFWDIICKIIMLGYVDIDREI